MNEKRRRELKHALSMMNTAESIIDSVYDKEQDCMGNWPDNLQSTEQFEKMEDAVENLCDALEKINEVKECISVAIR